jgi:Flp pilus assembly protein protease CpaA
MHLLVWLPLGCLLATAVITDLKKRMIYDWLTVPGLVYFLAVHFVLGDISWLETFGGALGLGGISLLMAVVSKGRFGGGDIKLFAVLGACLGWSASIWVFLLTFLLAALAAWPILLIRKLNFGKRVWATELPMAPFMAASTMLIIFTAYSF